MKKRSRLGDLTVGDCPPEADARQGLQLNFSTNGRSVAKEQSLTSWQQALIALSRTFIGLVIVLGLSRGRPVLIPIALATLLTFLLNPLVRRLQQRGLGRVVSVIAAVSAVGIVFAVIGVVGSRQISRLISEIPENTAKITAKVKTLKQLFSGPMAHRFEEMIEEVGRELRESADSLSSDAALGGVAEPAIARVVTPVAVPTGSIPWMSLTGYLGSAFEVLATMAFTFVLLVFFLLEREGLRDRLVLLAGKTNLTLTSKALEDATDRVSRYIVMVAIVNGGFGVLLTAGLFLLGLPYAVLWGSLAALLRFVPYIGPWVGAVFPIAMSLAMSEGWWQPIAVFIFVMVLELISNNIVEPLAFGRTTGVAPAALLISAAFWLFLWGPIGLILSAPFAVCLVVLGKNIPQLGFLNVLLGDQPALTADVGFYQRLLVRNHQEAAALVVTRLQQTDAEQVFDELLIPALNYAKRDLKRGHLTDEEGDSLLESLNQSFAEVNMHRHDASVTDLKLPNDGAIKSDPGRLKVIACSTGGATDRTALAMLSKLLDPTRWDIEIISPETLTSELVARVALEPPAAICIAAIPPGSIAQARYLCKKLRSANREVPLIVGRWGERRIVQTDRDRLAEAGATIVTTTLLETRQWLESRHPFLGVATEPSIITTRAASASPLL